jgi:hypothetical protein
VIFRFVAVRDFALKTPNLGEQITVIILAVSALILLLKGKDRLFYIVTAAWIGYFILDQLFELPGLLATILNSWENLGTESGRALIEYAVRIVTMLVIIGIGALIVEYINDGTICNRVFNVLCAITVLLLAADIIFPTISVLNGEPLRVLLIPFNNMYRLAMVFLFAFFAYDAAKAQLKKVDFSE